MALARVQSFSGTNTTFSSTVTTAAVTTTTGHLLIAVAAADTVEQNGIIISDNKGNVWTRAVSAAIISVFDVELWYSVLTTGGASHTVTATDNGGGVDSLLIVEEWSGQAATSPFDYSGSGTGNGTIPTATTAKTSQATELVVGAVGAAGNTALTLGSGYTNLDRVNTTFSTLGFESKTISVSAAQTANFTLGAGGSWVCLAATFGTTAVPVRLFPPYPPPMMIQLRT